MNLDCPSCGTTFRLPEGVLGDKGRKLRCAACKYVWFQESLDESLEVHPVPEAPAPDAEPEPRPEPAPTIDHVPHGDNSPVVPPSDPAPDHDAETESEPIPSPAADESRFEPPVDAPEPTAASSGPDDFNVRPSCQLAEDLPAPDYDVSRVVQPDAAPEELEPRSGGSWGLKIFLLLVIGGILFAWFEWRTPVMKVATWMIPVYETAGLVGPPTSVGLDYRDVALSVEQQNGHTLFIVSGQVVNISDEIVRVPLLRAEILDPAYSTLRDWSFSANAIVLGPGDRTLFRNSYPNPPLSHDAINLFLTFEDQR